MAIEEIDRPTAERRLARTDRFRRAYLEGLYGVDVRAPGVVPPRAGLDGDRARGLRRAHRRGGAPPLNHRRLHYGRGVALKREPDLAEELEMRDELLIACREVLLTVGAEEAAALVAHIDALLDLDDEASPGSQR